MQESNKFWDNRKIYPSITTTEPIWKNQIKELKELGLKEFCLFLTCLDKKKREALYKILGELKIEKIPLIHIKEDMELGELDYLVKKYKPEAFNIHSQRQYPFNPSQAKYKDIIFIENSVVSLEEEELRAFAGVCLDLSHLEEARLLNPSLYQNYVEILKKFPCGCNHISAIKESPFKKDGELKYSCHYLAKLSELDYLKRFPREYFSSIIALELENTISQQLKARDYIIDLLKDK